MSGDYRDDRGEVVQVSLTTTLTAYAGNDVVSGKLTLANAVMAPGAKALLTSLTILDNDNVKPTGYVVIFRANPTAATLTDNAALVWSTDLANVTGIIPVTAGDWISLVSKGICQLKNLAIALAPASGQDVYAVFVVDAAFTFTTTSALKMIFGMI